MIRKPKGFQPDRASPPGDTILDLMQERGWSQAELSQRPGFSTKHLNQLIKGQEHEADQWAGEQLIPPAYRHELAMLRTESEIRAFADKINIHPGIVTGRLQHEKKTGYSRLNKLKESVSV